MELNRQAIENRATSPLIHKQAVKQRVQAITSKDAERNSPLLPHKRYNTACFSFLYFPPLPSDPFPQTEDIRQLRARLKKGELSQDAYDTAIAQATTEAIRWQEEIGLDVLVHGEFERNDMVEYFGEQLDGLSSQNMAGSKVMEAAV